MQIVYRPRRNRKSEGIRNLIQETTLYSKDLILPFFVIEGEKKEEVVQGFPLYRYSKDLILKEIEKALHLGISSFAIFPVIDPELRSFLAEEALSPDGLIPRTIRLIKKTFPESVLISDLAFDPYTTSGHDGVLDSKGLVDNDQTVALLAKMAIVHAEAGIDIVAPSDMMDGRVGEIRKALDEKNFTWVSILSYTAKYASQLYSPFRAALQTKLTSGDKKNYQMDPANRREALREAKLDEEEGADILMVKPALFYLDVLVELRKQSNLPLAAFQVSGEYCMIKSMQNKNLLFESVLCIKRAGADMIFTYGACEIATMIKNGVLY